MITLCIGVVTGGLCLLVAVLTHLRARPATVAPTAVADGPAVGSADAGPGAGALAAPAGQDLLLQILAFVGAIPGVMVALWGAWELVSSVLQVQLLGISPVAWVFWVGCGVADALVGCGLVGVAALALVAMLSRTHAAAAWRWRVRLARTFFVTGPLQIVLSVAYFLF